MHTILLIIQMLLGSILLISGLVKLMLLLMDNVMTGIPPARGLFPAALNGKRNKLASLITGLMFLVAGAGLLLMTAFAGYEKFLLSAF